MKSMTTMTTFYSQVDSVENISHVNFSSIEQYRNFVKELRKLYKGQPVDSWPEHLNLRGTVKLHGTHADIVYTKEEKDDGHNAQYRIHYQSRNRVLSTKQDNCGFVRFMEKILMDVKKALFEKATEGCSEEINELMLAGEFCGNNVQKGVALTELPLMFVIFAIKINGTWRDITKHSSLEAEEHRVYNICRGGIYRLKLDLHNTEDVVSSLTEITNIVEKECPFAKKLGASGIGEGVVWVCEEHGDHVCYWFKVKGDEHSVSKVTKLKELSQGEKEQLKNVAQFVKQAVLEGRLRQGFDYLREMNLERDIKNIGTYIKWVVEDVLKEEKDVIAEMGLDVGKVKKAITPLASGYYKAQLAKPQITVESKDDATEVQSLDVSP